MSRDAINHSILHRTREPANCPETGRGLLKKLKNTPDLHGSNFEPSEYLKELVWQVLF
jgi:DTW domain-containing protein YfiP